MSAVVKLTSEVIQDICARKRADPSLTQEQLAEEFNLNRTSIKKALVMLDAPVPANDTGIVLIDHSLIIQSAFNPRKTFDQAEISELAESIKAKGLLQNLVVRKIEDGGGLYELVAGERRWRAIADLIRDFRWEGGIPCRIVEASNAEHLSLSIIENLQRVDVLPLEEADAFVQLQALDPEEWTAQKIAAAISRTPRYVYQRLAMATNLCDDAKTLLRAGKLNVEGARLLSAETVDVQKEILAQHWENWLENDATADVEVLAIADDDEALEVGVIRGELNWRKRREENRLAHEARQAEYQARMKSGDTSAEPDGEDDPEETEEEKTARLAADSERTARIAKNQEEYEARKAAAMVPFAAVTRVLPTDWPIGEERQPDEKFCNEGCKFRNLLSWNSPTEFHVCLNPNSPRAGLLTGEEQGGRDCFTV